MLVDFWAVGFAAAEFGVDVLDMLPPPPDCSGNGLALRLGWKFSSRSFTKFEGNSPTMRLSRLNRPIHHDPSPALRHSIRSPSMKPRSRFVCEDCHVSHASFWHESVRYSAEVPLLPMSRRLDTSRGTE